MKFFKLGSLIMLCLRKHTAAGCDVTYQTFFESEDLQLDLEY